MKYYFFTCLFLITISCNNSKNVFSNKPNEILTFKGNGVNGLQYSLLTFEGNATVSNTLILKDNSSNIISTFETFYYYSKVLKSNWENDSILSLDMYSKFTDVNDRYEIVFLKDSTYIRYVKDSGR